MDGLSLAICATSPSVQKRASRWFCIIVILIHGIDNPHLVSLAQLKWSSISTRFVIAVVFT